MNNDYILEVKNLSVHFGSLKAVDEISFKVKRGEVFGLVGESGCGKTTTGRAIIKLYEPTSGEIILDGHPISRGKLSFSGRRSVKNSIIQAQTALKEARSAQSPDEDEIDKLEKTINEGKSKLKNAKKDFSKLYRAEKAEAIKKEYAGRTDAVSQSELRQKLRINRKSKPITQIQMIFQDPVASLDPRMTVRDIVAEGLIIGGHTKDVDEKVYKVLESVGLVRENAQRYPHEFSGGQRQRIGIARAIIMQPKIIIADEPVSALDVSIQAQVITILNNLRKTLGLTVIFIAHDIAVVKYISDRIAVMYYGKIVEEADGDELFAHPFHPYTRSLFSAIPFPDPAYEKTRTRFTYNPITAHDYSIDKPEMREVSKNHFVYCNREEFKRYTEELKASNG